MMAAELDRLVAFLGQAARGPRSDQPVAPRPDGKMRHRRLVGDARDRRIVDGMAGDPLVEPPDIVLPRVAGKGRSERDDRFDLYYFWGQGLYETGQDALAFEAFRQAINQDPANTKDASLWAKYYLGILYERRGEVKTAQQFYHTLLRERNVDDLHQQVEQRLAQLR